MVLAFDLTIAEVNDAMGVFRHGRFVSRDDDGVSRQARWIFPETAPPRSHGCWINGYHAEASIAGEVGDIERQDMRDTMYLHGGHEPGVMNLDTCHLERHHQPTPFRIKSRRIGQQRKEALNQT